MKISELLGRLEEIRKAHGDNLPVLLYVPNRLVDLNGLYVEELSSGPKKPPYAALVIE